MYEQSGNTKLYFFYDPNGIPVRVRYQTDPNGGFSNAYYITNWRGDVTSLYSSSGAKLAAYEYDAWGNVISVKDASGTAITDQNHIANLNPLRYRGYYYDNETGFYYLQSRYYDPMVGRFLNADSQLNPKDGMTGMNMFTYCGNNPVNISDPTGHSWKTFWSGVGNFFKKVGAKIGGFCKKTFGAGSSIAITTIKTETKYIPDPWPITAKSGVKYTHTVSSYGDSSKPVSVYAKGSLDYPIKSSSAGIKLNISRFTFNISAGLDNIGVSGSLKDGIVTNSLEIKANVSELKVEFEGASAIKWDNATVETTYTNVSISGWSIVAICALITTGQSMPSPQYAYRY